MFISSGERVMSQLIMERWKLFMERSEEETRRYDGSPLESNGSTVKTNEKNRRKKQKKASMMGLDADALSLKGVDLEEDKEKKNCVPGNPIHRKSDGRFGKKDDAGSWSLDYGGSGNEPCERGVLRKPGSNQRKVWTKADDCGRRGPYKCGTKDEKRSPYKEGIREFESVAGFVKNTLLEVLEDYEEYLMEQEGIREGDGADLADVCRKKYGLMSLKDFLLLQQRLVSSSKGDLFKKGKG
jgi:hypothetical protein